MTDNDIIQALKCCTGQNGEDACVVCPFINTENCMKIEKLALDLINRQRAEIEGLKIANEKMYVANKEQEAEIDKLCIEIDELIIAKDLLFDEAKALILKAKAEAIQGFADRLKENTIEVDVSFGYGKEHYTEAVTLIEIDNLVKEMISEKCVNNTQNCTEKLNSLPQRGKVATEG